MMILSKNAIKMIFLVKLLNNVLNMKVVVEPLSGGLSVQQLLK